MNNFRFVLAGLLVALTGCQSVHDTLRATAREFYSGSDQLITRENNGFRVTCPATWGWLTEEWLDGPHVDSGLLVAIVSYEWSPTVQFNKLGTGVQWSEDMARLDAELSSRQELQQVQVTESLTVYNKLTGHGLRKVGVSRGLRSEFILFYPEGEMGGTRLLVLLYGSPNAVSLREMDGVIRSVLFKAPNSSEPQEPKHGEDQRTKW